MKFDEIQHIFEKLSKDFDTTLTLDVIGSVQKTYGKIILGNYSNTRRFRTEFQFGHFDPTFKGHVF